MGNKETGVFDFGKFKEALSEFYSLKEKHTPYYYREWTTSSDKADSPTAKCKVILEKLAKQIELLTKSFPGTLDKRPEPHPCRGATYFPRHPWVSILFRNEKQTDGLYPALGLSEYGMIVACGESERRPQPQFDKIRLTGENIADEGDDVLRSLLTEHLSKNFGWFPKNKPLDKAKFVESWRKAVDDYMYCRFGESGKTSLCHQNERPCVPNNDWFTQRPVQSISSWIDSITGHSGHWVFRGQGKSKWSLETNLERAQKWNSGVSSFDSEKARDYENEIIQEFRRHVARMPEYSGFCDLDLLTVMQHYGSTTRLLDFTYSPLVALYFAMEQYEKDSANDAGKEGSNDSDAEIAVWAVNADKIETPQKMHTEDGLWVNVVSPKWWEKCKMWHDDAMLVMKKRPLEIVSNGVDVLIPNANNERLSAQEGLFLMPRNVGDTFVGNLYSAFPNKLTEKKHVVIKYVFPKNLFDDIKDWLQRLCITPKMVYPDLTGLAKSMNAKLDFGREEERWA